ncbi:MAG: AsnC family transcriptional regulator [Candidatus Bathyarchaeia archaeon]
MELKAEKTKQIDETDSKILNTLLIESRTSFTELAKISRISVTAAIRRYNRLKKTGIICGEHMHINPLSVGYESIAEIGIMTDLADKEKAAQALSKRQSIRIETFTAASSLGKYNIYGQLRARKLAELTQLVQRIDIKPFTKSLDILIFADLWNNPWHPENLVVKPSERENFIVKTRKCIPKFEHVALDEIDKRIMKMLMENSRIVFKDIAEKTKISTKNVIQRYQFLREKNVLNLSTISVDLFKLGYNAILDIYINVDNRGTLHEVEAQLLQTPNLVFCAKFVGGAYDLRVAIILSNFEDVFRLKKQINSIENIRKTEFYLHEIPGPWPSDILSPTLL